MNAFQFAPPPGNPDALPVREDLTRRPDLTDPVQLIAELESVAGGLDQQAEGVTRGMGHHNQPYVMRHAAAVARAAAALIRKHAPPPPAESQPAAPGGPETVHGGPAAPPLDGPPESKQGPKKPK